MVLTIQWWIKQKRRDCITNFLYYYDRQRFGKPGNQIPTKMKVFCNPCKLIPIKINESTVKRFLLDLAIFQVLFGLKVSQLSSYTSVAFKY